MNENNIYFTATANIVAWLMENTMLVATMVGALISSPFIELKTKKEFITSAASSVGLTYLFGDWLSAFAGLNGKITGAFIGIFGLSLCSAAIKIIRKFSEGADPWCLFKDLIQSHFGGNKPTNNDNK